MASEEDSLEAQKFEESISATGFGKFNYFLLVVSFFGTMAIIFASSTASFIMPSATCDLDLSLKEKGLLNSMAYYGMLVSGVPWAILSDFRGRKIVLVLAHILDAIVVFICALSQGSLQLMICKFINGVCISGGYSCMMTYLSETHAEKYRQQIFLLIGFFLTIASIILPLGAMAILPGQWVWDIGQMSFHSWNLYIFVTGLPSLVVGIAFILLPESPKYSMNIKNYTTAADTFSMIFHMNTGEPKEQFAISLPSRKDSKNREYVRSSIRTTKARFLGAFTISGIWNMIIICMIDFCVLMSQNTLRLWMPSFFAQARIFDFSNSTTICPFLDQFVEDHKAKTASNATMHRTCGFHLNPTSYISNVIVNLVSVVGYITAILLVRKVGIKLLLVVALACCCVFGFLFILVSSEALLVTGIALYLAFENLSSTAVINVIVQLYPTQIRNTVLSTGQFIGRIGSSVGNSIFPIIMHAGCSPPVIWMGAVMAFAFVCGVFIKNPKNVPFQ